MAYQNVICRRLTPVVPSGNWSLAPLLPRYKLAPELTESSVATELALALWPGESKSAVAESVRAWGGSVLDSGPQSLQVRLAPGAAGRLAALEQVSWIQEPDPIRSFNCETQWVLQSGWSPAIPSPAAGRPVWQHGLRGRNTVIGLADAGIFTDHDQFSDPQFPLFEPGVFSNHRKVVSYRLYRNATFGDISSYHGTGVAGTLAGNDSVSGNSSKNDGMAPDARISFLDVATASGAYVFGDDLTDLLDTIRLGWTSPVRQTSGSWGSDSRLGYYRMMEATLDAVAWKDRNFLLVWAAGNNGGGTYNIGHPACAKSCLTVGASGNSTQSDHVASFSSRGPTRDERIKPELVAPGEFVTSADGPAVTGYLPRNGTSFSAPATSGALALVRQYLAEGWHPAGRPDSSRRFESPSSALMRALAVMSTDQSLVTGPVPNADAGWGRPDLSTILHFPGDSVELVFTDDTVGLATGEYHEYKFTLDSRRQLKVVLAWTDTAAAPEALVAIVNDLDLELIGPDLNGYRGNQFSNGQSRANPADWDQRNVLEVCLLQLPVPGEWTLRVRARNAFTERQPYALVVRANLAGIPGVREPAVEPGLCRFASRSRPARFALAAGSELLVVSSDGRGVARIRPDRERVVELDKGLAAGVYFYRIATPGLPPTAGRIVLAD